MRIGRIKRLGPLRVGYWAGTAPQWRWGSLNAADLRVLYLHVWRFEFSLWLKRKPIAPPAKTITFANGSSIEFTPGTEPMRGYHD